MLNPRFRCRLSSRFEQVAAARGVDGHPVPVAEDQEVDTGEVAVELGDGALAMGDAQIVERQRYAQT